MPRDPEKTDSSQAFPAGFAIMSNLKDVRAPGMLVHIRGDWGLENRCQWVLGIIYRQNPTQTRDPAYLGQLRLSIDIN